jgi:predicted phosphoribosyltransferase
MRFTDRRQAGRLLAERLVHWRSRAPIVLGVPRGGVPVAFGVAERLGARLDVLVAHKLGVPYQPEVAMGAVAEGGVDLLADAVVRACDVTRQEVAAVRDQAREEVTRRVELYRAGRDRLSLDGQVVIIVDDGIATGATVRAACVAARDAGAIRVVVAVPVAPADAVRTLWPDADGLVTLTTPDDLVAVGAWYDDFHQVTDDEVTSLLDAAGSRWTVENEPIVVPDQRAPSEPLPEHAVGLVILPYSGATARFGTRGQSVSDSLSQMGYRTVLVDLLTADEERRRGRVHDVALLADRLRDAIRVERNSGEWLGCFATGTGAAAALWTAADPDSDIGAIVCHNGRVDLPGPRLADVTAPTLLVVGARDRFLLDVNQQAAIHLRCPNELHAVPGATDQLNSPEAQMVVAELAGRWFDKWHSHPVARAAAGAGR